MFYKGRGKLSRQELECLEMFQLYESGGQNLILKSNIKKWEYKLYGGRPEFYPQDRLALFTMMKFRSDKLEHERKHAAKQAEMQRRLGQMKAGGGR